MQHHGLQSFFEENREQLLRYLKAHGSGDHAEDLLQELWIRISSSPSGPVASPRSYLFRAATNLMIDRRRAESQGQRRELEWSALADRLGDSTSSEPSPERELDARRTLEMVKNELRKLPARALAIFREHRIDGLPQREIAQRRGISVSTVESDLRQAYRLLGELRERLDEE